MFQAFAHEHDEHDFRGREVLSDRYRRDGGDHDGQIRGETPLEQVKDRLIDNLVARNKGQEQSGVEAEQRGKYPEAVQQKKDADGCGKQGIAPHRSAMRNGIGARLTGMVVVFDVPTHSSTQLSTKPVRDKAKIGGARIQGIQGIQRIQE